MDCWIKALEFEAGIGGGETPVDAALGGIAIADPSGDLVFEGWPVAQAPIETLLSQGAQLNLGDVEPTAVFGRVMKLQAPGQAPSFWGREGLIE